MNASPGSTQTYTVTGTDANGCQNPATSTITVVGSAPIVQSVTATPATVCDGGTSQLNVVAGQVGTNSPTGGAITINTAGNANPYPAT